MNGNTRAIGEMKLFAWFCCRDLARLAEGWDPTDRRGAQSRESLRALWESSQGLHLWVRCTVAAVENRSVESCSHPIVFWTYPPPPWIQVRISGLNTRSTPLVGWLPLEASTEWGPSLRELWRRWAFTWPRGRLCGRPSGSLKTPFCPRCRLEGLSLLSKKTLEMVFCQCQQALTCLCQSCVCHKKKRKISLNWMLLCRFSLSWFRLQMTLLKILILWLTEPLRSAVFFHSLPSVKLPPTTSRSCSTLSSIGFTRCSAASWPSP